MVHWTCLHCMALRERAPVGSGLFLCISQNATTIEVLKRIFIDSQIFQTLELFCVRKFEVLFHNFDNKLRFNVFTKFQFRKNSCGKVLLKQVPQYLFGSSSFFILTFVQIKSEVRFVDMTSYFHKIKDSYSYKPNIDHVLYSLFV